MSETTKTRMVDHGDFKWRQRSGTPIAVRDMDDCHLVNTMRGLMRRLPAPFVAWHYWFYDVFRDSKWPFRQHEIYAHALKEIVHRTDLRFGEGVERAFTALTAMRMVCDDRGIEWWDHDKYCTCDPCKERARQGAEYHAKNPNFKPM